MIDLKLFWALAASIVAVVLFVPYLIDILRRKTQPQMYSWLIWTILQVVGAAAMFKGGAGYGSFALVVGGLMCFSIFLLSFKYGSKNVKRFDIYCLLGAIIAAVIYFFVSNPLYAVILAASIDLIGYFPTFRKVFSEPHSETLITYILSAVANLFSILALQQYTVTTTFYEIVLFAANLSLSVFIIVRRRAMAEFSTSHDAQHVL